MGPIATSQRNLHQLHLFLFKGDSILTHYSNLYEDTIGILIESYSKDYNNAQKSENILSEIICIFQNLLVLNLNDKYMYNALGTFKILTRMFNHYNLI